METTLDRKTAEGNASVAGVQPIPGAKQQSGKRVRFQLRSFYLLGTRVDNIDGDLARRIIRHYIADQTSDRSRKIFFTNVHSVCTAQQDEILKQCLNLGDLVLPDGSGMKIGGKMSGNPIVENLNGTDFTPKVLAMAEEEGWTVFLLGAKEHIVQLCRERILRAYPKLRIVGCVNGYFTDGEEKVLIDRINEAHPDILLVALGTPKQEVWLTRHAHSLNVKVSMAVGGLFDFLSMTKRRAPYWMRRLGIEWLFRFFYEPQQKWKRVVIEIPMYLSMLVAQKYIPKPLQRRIRKVIFS